MATFTCHEHISQQYLFLLSQELCGFRNYKDLKKGDDLEPNRLRGICRVRICPIRATIGSSGVGC